MRAFGRLLMRTAMFAALPAAVAIAPAQAADTLRVLDPWARATVPGQKVAGVYMDLVSAGDARLTAVASPVAGSAEVHWMKMEGGIMKMRAVEFLDLPAGKTVSLAPGGYHLMLLGLKKPLNAGEKVPLTLTVEEAGKTRRIEVTAIVRSRDAEPPKHDKH